MKVRLRVRFRGRVQGVFFRRNFREKAEMAGLSGWVKNHKDGSVEAVVEGEEDAVRALLDEVRSGIGMGTARVDDLQASWLPYAAEFPCFTVVH